MNVYICHITSASLGPASTRLFQLNLKCQWTHPIPWEIILITDFTGELCNHFSDEETHNADATRLLSLFARNPGKSVDKITAGHLSQNKNKRPRWQWAFKFAALPRKRRKRLYDVENFAYKLVRIVLMWRPAFGSQVTSRNRDSFSPRKRENPGNVVVLRDLPIVGFVKYLKDQSCFTALTLQGVLDLYLYGYESLF